MSDSREDLTLSSSTDSLGHALKKGRNVKQLSLSCATKLAVQTAPTPLQSEEPKDAGHLGDLPAIKDAYPEPVKILPFVFLGNYVNATDRNVLVRFSIRYILNVASECENKFSNDPSFRYMNLGLEHASSNIIDLLDSTFEFIESAVRNQTGVLVHCNLGVSRSAAITVAYVMKSLHWPFNKAYEFVKDLSPVVCPNLTLVSQLTEYEAHLFNNVGAQGSTLRTSESFEDKDF